MSSLSSLSCLGFLLLLLLHGVASLDYKAALTKSLLYFEAQRSGRLPRDQRVQWRGDSGLNDGSDAGIDLVGGYYDAGDNVKFGFPLAFTVTMLSWSVVEFGTQLSSKNELHNALQAIKWGTDYLIKAHPQPNVLYGEVGDGDSDHGCWQRPEDMATPRTTFKIDEKNPGADLAGETSAALAAAAIAFRSSNSNYSSILLNHAKQLFDFARNHQGLYQNSIPVAGKFYSSSGYEDELLWAAAWLHRATSEAIYRDYLGNTENTGGSRSMFSWDDKFLGAQVLVSKLVLEGKVADGDWDQYKSQAEQFICSCVQKGSNNIKTTPAGALWWQPWNGLQYTTSALFVLSAYSNYLSAAQASINCQDGTVSPTDLIKFVQSQVDYILGSNPRGISYMVGFGSKYPEMVHHRGASIVSIKKDPTPVTCKGGFDAWFNKNAPNPNVLEGAIIGGPDVSDGFTDSRSNFQQSEPATVNTAPLVGVLAKLA
ncbi:endoglucanase 13-like [Macadamia integrifolia]|uniref:endoglucanase 13-like n=1 Tax=Macadamia integrifolia TaxID=60698 RepID=UPI001C4F6284|nr:endoglucanase 13-like [Macadamia integrifolia]